MAHYHVDGTLIVAKLKRGLIGGAVYQNVTIRQPDGTPRKIGTILALDDMKHGMAPGSRGRFYFYDVLGSKGIYGIRPLGGRDHAYFPYRWDLMTTGLGALNLLMALGWWLLDDSFALWATIFGVLGIALGLLYFSTRLGAMQAYRSDEARAPTATELKASDAPA